MDFPKDMHIPKYHSSSCAAAIFFAFLLIASLYVFISNPARSKPLFSLQDRRFCCSKLNIRNSNGQGETLEAALGKVSTANKSLIIAIVNRAYVEGDKPMLDMFLDSFWLGEDTRELIDHLLLVTMDQTSHQRCMFLRLHCYKLQTDGVAFDGEKIYMSHDFIKMMWKRTQFLGDVLKKGYNFIFTDTDIMWLRNPFPRLILNGTVDLQISTDMFNGNEWSESNPINTGFYMVRSNKKTISLFDSWYARKDNSSGMKEQDVLENMMHEGAFKKLGLRVRFLNTLYFSGFCQNSKDIRAVATVHANCCKTISAKIADLMAVIHSWKNFKSSLPLNQTYSLENLTHVECKNSWKKS